MGRAIKFRVWDSEAKRMIDIGETIRIKWTHSGDVKMVCGDAFHDDFIDGGVEHFELMQFTGLVDKNGTDIYEGDIVRKHSLKGVRTHEVIFKDGAFVIQLIETGSDPYYLDLRHDLKDMEVIGNVHETPEQGAE